MAKRTASGQTRHDRTVERIADRLAGDGYTVSADVPSYPRPGTLCNRSGGNCRRPDIIAKKGGSTRIIEVETAESYDADRAQHMAFRDYADRHKNVSFRIAKIVGDRVNWSS